MSNVYCLFGPGLGEINSQLADCSEEAFQHDIRDLIFNIHTIGMDVKNEVLFLS